MRAGRARALRRAWRTFWWMVVHPTPGQSLSRRTYLGIALREARCGLLSGGQHSWGPLKEQYPGQVRRQRKCRWCKALLSPASEIERTRPSDEEMECFREEFIREATPEDAQHALEMLKRQGIYRDGKILWD